jgi:hypothetical protein
MSNVRYYSAHVYQAAGMICVQADCSVDDALLLLIERADALSQPVEIVARDVVTHVIRFD